ncbi:MAG: hypothetical protein AB7S36_08445, partial [Planctomycetota bacterium]
MLHLAARIAVLVALLLVVAAAHAQDPPPAAPDYAADIAALAANDDTATAAIAHLKAAPAGDIPALKAAANESEADFARRFRARAILRYREADTTEQWVREAQYQIDVASWDIPAEAPDFVREQKAAARAALLADTRPELLPVLLTTYPEEDYPRYAMVRDLLRERGGDEVIAAVQPFVTHTTWIARLRAVHLLGLIGGEAAMAALAPGAADANATVRQRVLQAWVEAGGQWSAKVATFLADADAAVRVVALRGLSHDDAESAVKAAARIGDDSFFVRRAAAEVTATFGETGFHLLMEYAMRETPGVATLAAIRALGLIDGNMKGVAVDALTSLVRKSADWSVRAAAVEGLTLAGQTDALAARRAVEKDPFVSYRIAQALDDLESKWEPAGVEPADPSAPAPTPTDPNDPATTGFDNLRWLPADEAALDDALRALKMTRKDLEFDRNMTRDEFRFPLVQTALDQPLQLADIARRAVAPIREAMAAGMTGKLLNRLGQMPRIVSPFAPLADAGKAAGMEPAIAAVRAAQLPTGLATALVTMLEGSHWHDGLHKAFAGLTAEDRAVVLSHPDEIGWDLKLLPVWKRMNRAALMAAINGWSGDVWLVLLALQSEGVAASLAGRTGTLLDVDTPLGKVLITGHDAQAHTGHHLLLIDLGGDDSYDGPASGSAVGGADVGANALSATIDLAGNDTWRSATAYAQGTGILGVGLLYDAAGNDHYIATHNCQGCGWFGGGMLADLAGDDRYDADTVCQGASGFGVGGLIDMAGDDVYYARAYAQGFGFTQGVGALCEVAGNDLYYVDGKYLQYETMPHRKLSMGQGMGYGMRSDASGGIGILWDKAGDDVYRVNAFGQGSSYWYSLGMLVDEDGYDNYSAKIYSMGSGIHMGVGCFADLAGYDNYTSWGLSMSGSH